MSKSVKELMSEDLRRRCDGVDSACVIDFSGLDAVSTNHMRGALKKRKMHMHVVKNSLARRAFAGGPLEPLANSLSGPSAMVYGDPDIMDIAKELARWAKEHEAIELKHGIMDGDPDLYSVEALSKMKGRTELIGEIGMLISSPGRALAGQLRAPVARIAGCLMARIEKSD